MKRTLLALFLAGATCAAHAFPVEVWTGRDAKGNHVDFQAVSPQCGWAPFVIYYINGKSGGTCDYTLQNDILSFATAANTRVRVRFSKMHYSIQ
jgi:hypothetical protein